MGRKAALEENRYLYGTEEYKNISNKIYEIEHILRELMHGQITKLNIKKIYICLMKLDDLGLNFDIGNINSKVLLEFLKTLDLKDCNLIIKKLLQKCFNYSSEINPISYGYGKIRLETLMLLKTQ